VVEFNCRFGDPETQVVLPLVDADLLELLERTAAGALAGASAPVRPGAAACVVLAAQGYPGRYVTGASITGLGDMPEGVMAFHAGTRIGEGGRLVTAGGRVLGVVGRGADLESAIERAYAGVAAVRFEGMQYRRDIGRRGLAALRASVG
jgi:phosphoribosylamine--glycine ligase